MGCLDAFDESCERCECYNWEKKLTAVLAGLVFGVGIYFLISNFSRLFFGYVIMICVIIFLIICNLSYVLTSESFWSTPCELLRYGASSKVDIV